MAVPHRDATVLSPGTALSGRVSGQDLDVLGAFDGELELSGRLRLATGSKVKARVRAALVEIDGDFEGEVRAGTLRVAESAHARGLFFADRITVVEGARLEGGVNPLPPTVDSGSQSSSSGLGVDAVIPAEPGPEPVPLP
ncbi:MAG: hypothetical protein DMF78_11015 [Acidobacteria bacterium]|nr:MAG: hypothetical protein DMF78_11015 [Acidobacteriota bacterium]